MPKGRYKVYSIEEQREKHRLYMRQYYKDNHDKLRKAAHARYHGRPEKTKDWKLRTEYGITLNEYNQLLIKQGCACAICYTPSTELKLKLAVDHEHSTGKIRGLLCSSCNTAIGLLKDSTDHLESAAAYLRKAGV